MALISVENLTYKYPQAEKNALDGVSLEIAEGDYLALLGANGSGKSTLARLIAGFLEAESGIVNTQIQTEKDAADMGIVFQSPRDQVVAGIVRRDTSFGPDNLGLEKEAIEERVLQCLNAVNLTEKIDSSTYTLSMGQTQKLALAGILAMNSKILILDESLSMIDPATRSEILDYLDELNKKGVTIIHVTHDTDEARRAKKIVALDHGKIFFTGSPEDILKDRSIELKIFGEPLMREKPASFYTENYKASETVLKVDDVFFSYNQIDSVLNGISLELKKGTLNALVGASGCGKSTLFEIISGLLKADSGKIYVKGSVAFALQDSESALFQEFAGDDVAYGPINQGKSGSELKAIVKNAMDLSGIPFDEFADRRIREISGGEKRKVSLAGVIALDSDIIIFDEPTSALDPASQTSIMKTLRKLCDEGKTVLFSTHRLEEAAYADRCITMHSGKISDDTQKGLEKTVAENCQEISVCEQIKLLDSLRKNPEGYYTPKKSLIHNMRAWLKYLVFLTLFIAPLCFSDFKILCICIGATVLYSLSAKYPPLKMMKNIVRMLPWILFFVVFQIFFFKVLPTDTVYFKFGFLSFTSTKLHLALLTVLHLIPAIISLFTFLYSADETDIIDGIKELHLGRYFAMLLAVIFRFIPLLKQESALIVKAQLVRGGLKNISGPLKRIRAMIPVFVPLILQTLSRADNMGDTLIARGFK